MTTYKEILNNLEANFTATTGTNINKKGLLYGIVNGNAKEHYLQRLYNEDKFKKKILIERQNLEEAKETGEVIGIQQNPAESSTGYAIIQGDIGIEIPVNTEFTNGTYTYKTLTSSTISNTTQIITTLTRSGTIATAKTSTSHNLATGTILTISGANQSNFNRTDIEIIVISNDEFTYIVDDSGATTATGTILLSCDYAVLNLLCNQTGEDTNLVNGDSLDITSTITNVDNFCLISYEGLTGGVDEETLNDYKNRLSIAYANNTNDYASILIENTLIDKFSEIQQAYLVKNYKYNIKITSIRNLTTEEKTLYPDFDNNRFRVVETQLPHGISRNGWMIQISGSTKNLLNIPTGLAYYSIVYYILDIDKIIVYVGNTTNEDLVCTNVVLQPYSNQSTIFILKKGSDKYPTNTEIAKYQEYINTEILPFTDTNYYLIAPFEQLTIDFEISNIIPNNSGIKTAIENNLRDYFTNYVKGGQSISESQYRTIIGKSKSGAYSVIDFDVICKANNNIVSNISTQVYQYPKLNSIVIS